MQTFASLHLNTAEWNKKIAHQQYKNQMQKKWRMEEKKFP